MQSFSAMWSDKLGEAIRANCKEPYSMELHSLESIRPAIEQGIDSHLEAIFFEQTRGQYGRSKFVFTPESVPVLVRRLLEDGDDEAQNFASSICETLDIELV